MFSGDRVKTPSPDLLPTESVLKEIEDFRASYRDLMECRAREMDQRLEELTTRVTALSGLRKPTDAHRRGLRDMLTLLRGHNVDPAKARRKDIKKMDSLAEDLADLAKAWS